jgi:hypothetical protein
MWRGRDAAVEEEEEDPVVSNSPEAGPPLVSTCRLDRRSHSQTGTISRGGTRETVGLFVTANRYSFVNERVCGSGYEWHLGKQRMKLTFGTWARGESWVGVSFCL